MALVVAILLAVFVLDGKAALAAIVAGLAIEVGETWFWFRLSRRRRPAVGGEALVGIEAEVVSNLAPEGYVRVHGELWRARSAEGARPGERVRVRALDGLTLVVEPDRP